MISPLFFLSFDLCVCVGVGGVGGGEWGGGELVVCFVYSTSVASILFCLLNLSCVNFVMFIQPQLHTDVTCLFFFKAHFCFIFARFIIYLFF